MLFRTYGRIFNKLPETYWEEVYATYDALVTQQAFLMLERRLTDYCKGEILKINQRKSDENTTLFMKLKKTSGFNRTTEDFVRDVELRMSYVQTLMD